MPSKQKGPGEQKSKKELAAMKAIRATDQTFGLKNKNKSKKVQTQVSRVQKSLTGNEEAERAERAVAKKAKRAEREAAEREERALFSEGTDVLKVKKAGGSVEKAAKVDDGATTRALYRAKELFDAGAMTVEEYVEYKNQIMADASDSDDDEAELAPVDEDDSESDREMEEEEEAFDPRSKADLEDLYVEVQPWGDVDPAMLPDDDA